MSLPRLLRNPFSKQPPETGRAFSVWQKTPLGQAVLEAERGLLDDVLPSITGERALQISVGCPVDLLASSHIPLRWHLAQEIGAGASVTARPVALPIAKHSLDLVVLHHGLDFDNQPHLALRGAVQCLRPGGHLIVVGFQPLGLWGLVRLFRLASRRVPWIARFLRPHRVTDWLHVLDCEVEGFESRLYGWPSRRMAARLREGRGLWLERLGARFWSQHGAFYVLVAQRRAAMIRPLRQRFRLSDGVPNVIPVSMARWQQDKRQEQP